MDLSEENQSKLHKLTDMFSTVSVSIIRRICDECSWNMELCIEKLINPDNCVISDRVQEEKDSLESESKSTDQRMCELGAIPKNTLCVEEYATIHKPLMQINMESNITAPPDRMKSTVSNSSLHRVSSESTEQGVIEQILSGYRVMIILRGAPGSGKSHLAASIVARSNVLSGKYGLQDFILSTDDYFYDRNGRYQYSLAKLDDAHAFNKRRVRDKAIAGWSPIIVDNTHMKVWEMLPYVQIAIQHGYIVQLLEPNTTWKFSAGKLSIKNKHNVAREKIQTMLDRYERATVSDLLKMLKDSKYCMPLPQMRNVPYISVPVEDMDTNETFSDFSGDQNFDQWCSTDTTNAEEGMLTDLPHTPKLQRPIAVKLGDTEDIKHKNFETSQTFWKPFEKESNEFWDISEDKAVLPVADISNKTERSLLDLLKEGVSYSSNKKPVEEASEAEVSASFKRHKIGCSNENKSFASLRQIYPNKMLHGLWDLFVKCNGDIDWAVDILLKEDELAMGDDHYYESTQEEADLFSCACGEVSREPGMLLPKSELNLIFNKIKPQRAQRMRPQRNHQKCIPEKMQLIEEIENRFIFGDEHYSEHINKLRNKRFEGVEIATVLDTKSFTDTETQTDPFTVELEYEQENDNLELLEITLGEDLVKQLSKTFESELIAYKLPDYLKTNVFMPKALAKELFMLWMESAYNQVEEQRQSILRDDADFARLLKNPKYENCKESPENVKELLDMELAWLIYKNDCEQMKQLEPSDLPASDIATHLTQMKLCEIFPKIPRNTILDVFAAHSNNFRETVAALQGNVDLIDCNTTQNILLERVIQENQMFNNKHIDVDQNEDKAMHSTTNATRLIKPLLQPDEAKRLALRNFEDTRNFAAHHSQLKAECYQKAREAAQRGNSSVAAYYSQIANLHKNKIDMYNHQAANCIMEVHKYTQNNPDLLDLHYLHVLEAVGCLDLFLDRHITNLRNLSKSYKHLFIITGRGLHSTGGVSTIKSKVKSRLKERCLRWSEVNPGLLKVKIFSASRYSKNV